MTTIGMQSSAALATPVAQFVSPGLRWLSSTDASAGDACVAVGGVRRDLLVADVHELDGLSAMAASTAMFVWPQSPNTRVTPRRER